MVSSTSIAPILEQRNGATLKGGSCFSHKGTVLFARADWPTRK